MLLVFLSLAACSPLASSPPAAETSDAETASPPALKPKTPTVVPVTTVELGAATPRPTNTPRPTSRLTATSTPTPTPPPLPEPCLRQPFEDDIQICRMAPSYGIDLTIAPRSAQVTGRQVITYTNAEADALNTIVLRLLPNGPGYGGTVTVTHLLLSGQSVAYQTDPGGTALRVPLEPPLEVGQMVKMSMDFAVEVPTSDISGHGLFSYIRGVMALPNVYPLIPVYNERGWNTEVAPVHGDDIFADVAMYNVTVNAQSRFTLVATGTCGTPVEGTWTCEAAPMRDFTVILGENYERAAGDRHRDIYEKWISADAGQ